MGFSLIIYKYIMSIIRPFGGFPNLGSLHLAFCSGAVGMGCRELGLEKKPTNPEMKRAVAGVGQSRGWALKLFPISL